MIRYDFANFVELWNSHKVRTQPNRPHVVSGIPAELFYTDTVPNWGVPIQNNSEAQKVLRTMLEPLEDIEIDEFLTYDTSQWCHQQLQSLGFDFRLRTIEDHQRPHLRIYLQFRDIVRQHIDSGETPILELTPIPRGGTSRYVS